MPPESEVWADRQFAQIPSREAFASEVGRAQNRWVNPGRMAASEALDPFGTIGQLTRLSRYASPSLQPTIVSTLDRCIGEVRESTQGSNGRFTEAVSLGLDYMVRVPEAFIQELKELPVEEIRKRYSFTEVDGEIFEFLEEALDTIEGLRETVPNFDVEPWTSRVEKLRVLWDDVAPKVAQAFGNVLTRRRVDSLKIKPPEFWWVHRLVRLLEFEPE